MTTFIWGILSSLAATALIAFFAKWAWPNFADRFLYSGVRVDGSWDIFEARNGNPVKVGRIELKQVGRRVTGKSHRSRTRDGQESSRRFTYLGTINGNQVTLVFEDDKGIGFDTGAYVFTVQNDARTMIGMATFHGKKENKIVSEPRTLVKAVP